MTHSPTNPVFLPRFKRAEDAKMALEQMEGFELAGRQVRWDIYVGRVALNPCRGI